jgi:hypothetical protein
MDDKLQLLKRVGNIAQIAGIRRIMFDEGRGKGVLGFEVYNRAGLRFTVLPDKCLDIFDLSYKGINFSFQTKNGLVANQFFNGLDNEFLYYWSAGMVYTCGLANAGPPCVDQGLYRTEHGRIGMTPAENVCAKADWNNSDFEMCISGEVKETMVYGMSLKLSRTLRTTLDSREVTISDTVENLEPTEEEFMYLYHINFGYPLVDAGTRVVKPQGNIVPREERFATGINSCFVFGQAEDNADEEVFFHENASDAQGYAYVGVINDALKIGAYVKYTKSTLPVLVQWKSIRSHDYVLGIEPGNSFIKGRIEERENGTLPVIKPYGRISYEVSIGVLDGQEEIDSFVRQMRSIY